MGDKEEEITLKDLLDSLDRVKSGMVTLLFVLFFGILAILFFIRNGKIEDKITDLGTKIDLQTDQQRITAAELITSTPGGPRSKVLFRLSGRNPTTIVALGRDLGITQEEYEKKKCHFLEHKPMVGHISLICDNYEWARRKEPEGALSPIVLTGAK